MARELAHQQITFYLKLSSYRTDHLVFPSTRIWKPLHSWKDLENLNLNLLGAEQSAQ